MQMQDTSQVQMVIEVKPLQDALRQAQEFEEGMNERLEIATKKYNSLIGGLTQKTGYKFDFERFVGFISYHKINWKPLNSASFERLLYDFYKEEMNILGSFFDNDTPIDEKRILDIERKGKIILSNSAPPQQAEENVTLSHREISLLYYYDDLLLKDGNANEIANKYGQSSGAALMRTYREIKTSETNRRNNANSKACLERIIPLLTTPNGILKANEDLKNVKK